MNLILFTLFFAFTDALEPLQQGSKSDEFFLERSGAVERSLRKSVERSGAVERFS